MAESPIVVTIYHNPACGTSCNVLALIRNAGLEPQVIEYLKTPPDRATLELLLERMRMTPRALLREKGTPYAELGLADETLSGAQLTDAMMAHPILINRPIVVTPWGVKLCRPSEALLDILPLPQKGPFKKEDGELLIDDRGERNTVMYATTNGIRVPKSPNAPAHSIRSKRLPLDRGVCDIGALTRYPSDAISSARIVGVGIEQLLAVDLVARDGALPFG